MTELVTTYFVHFDDENFQLKQTEMFQHSDQDSVTEENSVRLWTKVYRRATRQHKTLNNRHSSFQAVFQPYIQNFCVNYVYSDIMFYF